MTEPFADQPAAHTEPLSSPPPGCPAHGSGPNGVARLFGAEALEDPWDFYESLRVQHGPVAPVLLEGDIPAWLIVGYEEVLEVACNPRRFTRDSRHWRMFREGKVPDNSPILPMVEWQPLCMFVDGEEHERLRKAFTESMGRFDRRALRRYVSRSANRLIDDFGHQGKADLVSQFAEPLPMLVMTQLLGVSDENSLKLVHACRDFMQGSGTAFESNAYVIETLQQLVQDARANPDTPDLRSWLIKHPSGLTDDEIVQNLRLMLMAANQTTVNLIMSTVRMVLTDPRCRASLSSGQLTLPGAVEQMLWDEPPLQVVPGRWATCDTELGGQPIREGDLLLFGLTAGNVDPAIRPDPAVPMRNNRAYLSFGGGPHKCPGEDIGRAITENAVDILLTRLPDIELAIEVDELVWVSSWMSRHLAALPVEFGPTRPSSTRAAPQTPRHNRPVAPASSPSETREHSAATSAPTSSTSSEGTVEHKSSWWGELTRRLFRKR